MSEHTPHPFSRALLNRLSDITPSIAIASVAFKIDGYALITFPVRMHNCSTGLQFGLSLQSQGSDVSPLNRQKKPPQVGSRLVL